MSIGSSHTWWTCAPILFHFFTGSCSTLFGMCACIQLSLFGLLVMSSRHLCDMSWLRFLLIIPFFSNFFYLVWKILCTVCVLWWDYSHLTVEVITVKCGVWHLFKDINSCSVIWSSSMNSAGRPHFHVPCPVCVLFWLSRSDTATLFVLQGGECRL